MSRAAYLRTGALRVAAGIVIDEQGRLLLTDRSGAASMREFWEFPGGKLRDGESAEQALQRELREELGIAITRCEPFHSLAHDYPDFRVEIDFFLVTAWTGEPRGVEGQALRWASPDDLSPDILLPADAPIVPLLKEHRG